jgi:hypothetical protein
MNDNEIRLELHASMRVLDWLRYVIDFMPRDRLRGELKKRGLPVGPFKSSMVLQLAMEIARSESTIVVTLPIKPAAPEKP